jgi:hypothetical protein
MMSEERGMIKIKFTYKELALLNRMIGIALMSGKIEFNKTSESIHKKVSEEICKRNKTK